MEPTSYQHPYRGADWERAIYPMPAFPMLSVSDLTRSMRWYQDALGFADVFTMRGRDGAPLLAHLRWSTWADVLLTPDRAPIEGARGRGITLCFAVDSADEVAARAGAYGAEVEVPPVDRPWNARETTIVDPDGYRLTFTGPRRGVDPRAGTGESFDALIERLRDR